MSDLVGNHNVGFPTRRLKRLSRGPGSGIINNIFQTNLPRVKKMRYHIKLKYSNHDDDDDDDEEE